MKSDVWHNAIQWWHGPANDLPEKAVLLDLEPALSRLCGIWPECPKTIREWRTPAGIKSGQELDYLTRTPHNVGWLALWAAVDVDMEALRVASGLYRHEVKRLFEMAKQAKLIYPDGSLANAVRLKLMRMVAGRPSVNRLPAPRGQKTGGGR
jgi:hypothetical protein